MTLKDINFSVDMYGTSAITANTYQTVFTGDEDSVQLKFSVTDEEDLTGATALIHLYFGDSSHIERVCTPITGGFQYTLTGTENDHAGITRVDIYITKAGAKFTRAGYKFRIDKSLEASAPLVEYAVDTVDTVVKEAGDWLLQAQTDFGTAQGTRAAEWVADNDTRADDFNAAQTSRANAFSASEAARTITFNANETGRSNTFTVNENARQEAAEANQAQAATDHSTALTDHSTAVADSSMASSDHATATTDHNTAVTDHSTANADHAAALADQEIVDGLQDQFNDVIANVTVDSEVINARQGSATLSQNILSIKGQLADKATLAQLSGVATPLAVTLASQMTNTARVYIYMGVEVGYTAGNWYYHNGTLWVSGGVYQAMGVGDSTVTRPKLSADAKVFNVFDPSSTFLRDRGDTIMVSIFDSVIKYIYDLRLYNVASSDNRIYLWRIYRNGDYLQLDFKDSAGNIVCQAKELVSALNFVDDKATSMVIRPYGIWKASGFVSLNLFRITNAVNITNLTLDSTMLSQSVYQFIDSKYNLYPFTDYANNENVRNTVIDVKVYGDKTHVYTLDYLRINYDVTYSYIIEIKDVTANKVVSRIQSTGQFLAGQHTITLPEYQSSGVVSYITINGGGVGFTHTSLGLKLLGSCIYDKAYDIVLPSFIPCVANKELNIYSENLLSNAFVSQSPVLISSANGVHNIDSFTFKPTVAGTTVLYAAVRDKGIDTLIKRTNLVTVATTAGTGLTKKVMVIGDSKTDNPTKLAELVNLFDGDAMAIELIGTISENGTDADGATRAIKSEGRSSWGIDEYYNKATYNSMSNPFYNATSGLFDFTYYMTQNGFTGVDYVFIDLGANDTGSALTDIKTQYDYIIASIKAYDPNIKIIISLQEGHCLREATSATYQQNKVTLNKIVTNLLGWYGGQEGNNIYICPQYVNVDLYNDFPLVDVALSNRNPKIVTKCTDATHPANPGYYKIADMYYFMIKYLASIGA